MFKSQLIKINLFDGHRNVFLSSYITQDVPLGNFFLVQILLFKIWQKNV
jgi:hypothetical protein